MRQMMLLLLGAILIGVLSYFCFMDKADAVKDDLVSKATSAYATKQMDWVNVNLKGEALEMTRVMTLTGSAPNEALKEEAQRVALGIDGVESVDNQLVVSKPVVKAPIVVVKQKPAIVVPSPYELNVVKSEDGKVKLSGYVPNAEVHKELISQAEILFGDSNIIDELKEIKGAPDMWLESAKLGIDKLEIVDYGRFKISDASFIFKGFVSSIEQKEPLLKSLTDNLYSSYEGSYDIEAPEPKPEPAKAPVAVSCQQQFKDILSKDKIHFEYNKADVKKESYKLLDTLADVAKKCSKDIITISGHTDSIGSAKYNKALSAKRANAVKSYLVSKGVSVKSLKSVGLGESKPVADNNIEAGRAKNRRIEFNVEGVK